MSLVRFETDIGSFDVVLNPEERPELQLLVDNFLAYVTSERFDGAVINRAQEDFVVQMASFQDGGFTPDTLPVGGFPRTPTFDPVIVDQDGDGQVDFDTTGLSNTRGEISMALAPGNINSATSSFFVNLGDNSFLDAQGFVPFANIVDLAFFDALDSGPKLDLSTQVGSPGSLAYTDVPVDSDGNFVVISRAFVVPEPGVGALVSVAAASLGVGTARRSR